MEEEKPRRPRGLYSGDTVSAAGCMWVITLESGDTFTITAKDRGEATNKAVQYRGRNSRVAKVENVAIKMARERIKKP